MSINVMERTREIGIMRAIGAVDLDVQLIVIADGLVAGIASWLLAIIFGSLGISVVAPISGG